MLLELEGFVVRWVSSGAEAFVAVEAFRPSVVFIDEKMFDMNGCELAAALRQKPGQEGLRLIAVSCYGQDSDVRKSKAAGFDMHMVKPVSVANVVAAINHS